MLDCHVHTGIGPVAIRPGSPRTVRDDFAEWLREEAEAVGIDQFCVIMQIIGETPEQNRTSNETLAQLVRENPDIAHGWARVNPEWEEEAVNNFRAAIDDGLLGLKLTYEVKCDDPRVDPIAEAAIEMDVPVKIHSAHRVGEPPLPNESFTEDVVALARRYPDLKILESHIGGPGDWEYRIKLLEEQENVWLDLSGTNADAGMIEMAAERLGTDRLVWGSDNSIVPCVGKLAGADLSPDEKARIAYNITNMWADDYEYGITDEERRNRIEAASDRFACWGNERDDREIVVANSFVGEYPFREVNGSADELAALLDEKGIDEAIVSSTESLMLRNVHRGNRKLADRIADRDTLVPAATINPSYPGWRNDLDECLNEFGMNGVKLLPLYHDYDLDDPEVEALFERCAEAGVPVFVAATMEDQRMRHPRVKLRDHDEIGRERLPPRQVDALVRVLQRVPEADVVVADAWDAAARIKEETVERKQDVRLPYRERSGRLLFVLDNLHVLQAHRAEGIAEDIGADHLVVGPRLPFKTFDAYYEYVDLLPLNDSDKEKIRSGNLLDVLPQ